MNTPNNKRKKASIDRIEKVFIKLLQEKEMDKIRERMAQTGITNTSASYNKFQS